MRDWVLITVFFPLKARLHICLGSSYRDAKASCHHIQRKIIRQESHRAKKMKLSFSHGRVFQNSNYCLSSLDIGSVDKYNYFVCFPLTNAYGLGESMVELMYLSLVLMRKRISLLRT